MSEHIYVEPDLTKKVRFQKNEGGNREKNDKHIKDDVDSTRIYENWTMENSPPKVEDNTTEDRQQINSADVNSKKRRQVKAVILLLGLLCFLLLVTVIVLVIIIILGWGAERNLRTELQESYRDLERFNLSMTQWNRLLEEEKTNLTIERDQLRAINTNLTKETDELHKHLLEILLCRNGMWRFSNSWYFISNSMDDWTNSKAVCETLDATLAIISTEEEERFITSLNRQLWIGLTDEKEDGVWKWINGDKVTTAYWGHGQPDNCQSCGGEYCAEIQVNLNSLKNWNDLNCWEKRLFICEKAP